MNELLQKVASTVSITITDSSGNPINATGAVKAYVYDSAGVALLSDVTASTPAAGQYQITVTKNDATAIMDQYRAAWLATVSGNANEYRSDFEVVGGFMFSIAEIRAFDSDIGGDTATFTADKIRTARLKAQNTLEQECGRAFRPKALREAFDGSGIRDLFVPLQRLRSVVAGSIDDVALTSGELSALKLYPGGIVRRPLGAFWPAGTQNVELLVEHGYTVVPERMKQAAMHLAVTYLVESPVPARATSESIDGSNFRLSTAGRDRPTGIPTVDAAIAAYPRAHGVG